MVKNLLTMVDVSKTYSQGSYSLTVLARISCSIRPKDRICLLGPSGSGKSTLLHLMAALDQPTSGDIAWPELGTPDSLRPQRVAVIFQSQSLLQPLNVRENVELPLLLANIDADEAKRKAEWALDKINLADIKDKLPEELSGGQAQRVAVARALAVTPKLILADEPTGQLDQVTAQSLFDVLLDAIDDSDTALVVATHDLAIAKRLDSVWKINHGVLEVTR